MSKFRIARWACCAGGGAVLLMSSLVGTSAATAESATTAVSASVWVKAEADSWVSASSPTVNRGTASYLQVDASPVLRGYLRFTVPNPSGDRLSRAVLTVTPNQSNKDGLVVKTAGNSWTEKGITFRNAPAVSSTVSVRSGPVTAGVPVQIDVTAALPATGGPLTLVLENAASTSFSVRSREHATGSPTLQITTAATATTTTPTTPTTTTPTTAAPSPAPTTAAPSPAPTTAAPSPAPTTTAPSPAPTTAPSSTAGKLTWAPPALTNPVTYRVSGEGPGTITAPAGQDSIVVFDGPVNRRIRMDGGRHWIVRGGEVNNNREWTNIEEQSGLQFQNVTGTAFVEGILIHGRYGKDGIRVGAGGSKTTLIVQNSRILERMSGPTAYHTDIIQPFGGIQSLKVDRLTGSGDYQGQMWKQEPNTTFGPTDFRRVNFRAANPQVQYMINFVMSAPTQPVTLSEVYSQSDPGFVSGNFCRTAVPAASATCLTDGEGRKYLTWSGAAITVNGRVTDGLPPGGDFVPAGVAGLGYVSPGYV